MNLPHKAILIGKDAIVLNYDKGQIDHYHNISPPAYHPHWTMDDSYSTEEDFEKAFPNWVADLHNDEYWPSIAYFWIDLAALTNS